MGKSTKKTQKKSKKTIASNADVNKKALRERNQELLQMHAQSVENRVKGAKKHDKGNVGLKQTPCEVFIFLVIADEQLRMNYVEKFKNTRHFKKTIPFETVEKLNAYLKEYKFPKTSIFLAVVDYFFEHAAEEEYQKNVAIMQALYQQDPMMELIVLADKPDAANVKVNTTYGRVTFVKKTDADCFTQVLNNMIVAVHEQNKIRKQYDTKKVLRKGTIVAIILVFIMFGIDYVTGLESVGGNGVIGVLPASVFGK